MNSNFPGGGQNVVVQTYGDPAQRQVMVRVPQVGAESGGELGATAKVAEEALRKGGLGQFTVVGTEIVGPSVGKELTQQGFKPAMYTYSPSVANSLTELGGTAVEGIRSASYTVPVTSDAPAVKEYRDALAKYFPSEKPDYVSLTSFGLAKIFVEALNRINGPINRQSLVASMETLKNYDTGIIPPVSYGPDRHLSATILQRVQVSGGKWVSVGTPVDSEKLW